MLKNLKKYKKSLEKADDPKAEKIDFFPLTYNVPGEYPIFCEQFKRMPGALWIMKPVSSMKYFLL